MTDELEAAVRELLDCLCTGVVLTIGGREIDHTQLNAAKQKVEAALSTSQPNRMGTTPEPVAWRVRLASGNYQVTSYSDTAAMWRESEADVEPLYAAQSATPSRSLMGTTPEMQKMYDEFGNPDIIDELRQTAGNLINGVIDDGEVPVSMLTEAADKIERLLAAIAATPADCICNTDHPLFKERGHHPHCPVLSKEHVTPAAGGKNAREIAHRHCTCTCRSDPKVGQNHTNLCDEITKAILEFAALTNAPAVGGEDARTEALRVISTLAICEDGETAEQRALIVDACRDVAANALASPLITEDKLTQIMDEAWPDGHRVMARKIIAELGASPLRGREIDRLVDAVKRIVDRHAERKSGSGVLDIPAQPHEMKELRQALEPFRSASASSPEQPAADPVTGALNFVEQAAILIWCELCPGMMMSDEDLPHYEAAIRQAMRDLQSPADEETQA